jgi:predicted transcriptional regulator
MRLAITLDPEVHKNIVQAAAREGVSISAWMTTAAREALRRQAGLAAVELWEKEHGRFTEQELDESHHRVLAQVRAPYPRP